MASDHAERDAHFAVLPPTLSNVMAQSGGAIFGSLPLIFAVGVLGTLIYTAVPLGFSGS